MRRAWPGRLSVLCLLLSVVEAGSARAADAVPVDPAELPRRTDLVGQRIEVDDRVSFFQFHRDQGFDEIALKRCPEVVFWLPRGLRPTSNPQARSARIRGVLRREGERLRVEVDGFDLMPSDLDRLNAAIATLSKFDLAKRKVWIDWAERRARIFQDDSLLKKVRELESESLRTEAERVPRGTDPAAHWLALAERARRSQVPEPEPSALAHQGLRAQLTEAKTAAQLEALVKSVESQWPKARDRLEGPGSDLARWGPAYESDPAATYRMAPPRTQSALDHRLWMDAYQRLLERRAVDDPSRLLRLADDAARQLPERPEVARQLLQRGVDDRLANLNRLTRPEVDELGRLYREKLGDPDKGRILLRMWLDHQRTTQLARNDADGRLRLADLYEQDLGDRTTAIALVKEALKVDPGSIEVADALRRRGFRKVGNAWVEGHTIAATSEPAKSGPRSADVQEGAAPDPAERGADPPEPEERPVARARSDSLMGATAERVRSQFGVKPDHRICCASQGQIVEQWIFSFPDRDTYITFSARSGERHARVISAYSLPRKARGQAGSR